jgi:hypothetical protein
LSGVSIESPAVIAALDLLAIKLSAGERHPPMRTGIAQRKSASLPIASDDQRLLQQHGFDQLPTA